MVESTYGTENYKFNDIQMQDNDFFGNSSQQTSHCTGKERHGGVGGKGSKSNNFKE